MFARPRFLLFRWVGVAVLLSLAVVPFFSRPLADSNERPPVFAVLIGIQDYKHRGYSDLSYTRNDVLGLRDALTRDGGVPRANVRVLLNRQATKSAIRNTITKWLAGQLRKRKNRNATVVLFFAGHGESHDGMSYWLPYDVKKGAQHLEDTALSSDNVNSWLRKLNTSRVVIFADACHSGAWSSSRGGRGRKRRGARGKTSSKAYVAKGMGEGFIRISSSQQDQLSWEVDELKHGLFTYALIQGLKGAAHRSRTGAVTVGTLMAYLEEEVEALSKKYNKDLQRPVREGVSAGALPLSYPRLTTVAVSSTTPNATTPTDPTPTAEAPTPTPTVTPTPIATVTPTVTPTPSTPKAGDRKTFTAGSTTFAMRWIPAGTFVMGSPSEETAAVMASCKKDGNTEEKCKEWYGDAPQRRVRISKGFWMLESEVTQGQWKALMGSNPSRFSSCGDNCPVEKVSWHDARAFANKLSEATNRTACTATDEDIFKCSGWRLPTEAEWEYAARAGTTGTRYGDLNAVAWWGAWKGDGNSQVSYKGAFGKHGKKWGTHPVGGKVANEWGLHDMLGNVWEWTMDGYGPYAGLSTQDPLRSTSSGATKRVIRGGCWYNYAKSVRSAIRYYFAPTDRYGNLGFRLLRP